jgi:spore maturation protein A
VVNIVWLALLLSGIAVAAFNGNIEVVTSSAMEAAKNAVNIAFELVGIMALWLGLMKIAERAGIISFIAYLVRPLTKHIFPTIPQNHPAMGAIVMNISANVLGLGNAATPMGLKAMKELQKLNGGRKEASEAMCTLLAINTSCITLIPATIIGVRAAAGSSDPTAVVGTTIFATACATTAAVTCDRVFAAIWKKRKGRL